MNFNIESIKSKLLVKYPFFGSVVANVDYEPNKNIPTAGTDGNLIYYNPDYLKRLTSEEQTFVFAHEVCHIAFNHILRSEGKIPKLWNIATDAVINAFLKRDGLRIVKGGVDIADAINYDAEQLYEKLLNEKQQQQKNGQGQQEQNGQNNQEEQEQKENSQSQGADFKPQNSNEQSQTSEEQSGGNSSNGEESKQKSSQGGSSSSDTQSQNEQNNDSSGDGNSTSEEENQDVGHDTHSMWPEAVKKHKEEQEEKESKMDKHFNRDGQYEEQKQDEVKMKQEEVEQLGEKETFKKNLEEKKKELEKLKETLSEQVMGMGYTTNSDVINLADIGRSKPIIDWRYVLKEAIKYDVDWSYSNATIENGVIRANLEEQPMPETEIVLDTSGSINETLLKNFLRECKNILQHSRLKVGCFDTKFYGFHEIRTEQDIENMKFEGGGGTDFDVAVGAFSRRVENKIIFTDGEAYMPDMPLDAIWIVFGGKKINPKGGKVIQIDSSQLNSLYLLEQEEFYSKGKIR